MYAIEFIFLIKSKFSNLWNNVPNFVLTGLKGVFFDPHNKHIENHSRHTIMTFVKCLLYVVSHKPYVSGHFLM